jgi:hypothetical protein
MLNSDPFDPCKGEGTSRFTLANPRQRCLTPSQVGLHTFGLKDKSVNGPASSIGILTVLDCLLQTHNTMASQVPHSNTPLPAGRTAEKAAKELETPLDYKETFKVSQSPLSHSCTARVWLIGRTDRLFPKYVKVPCDRFGYVL